VSGLLYTSGADNPRRTLRGDEARDVGQFKGRR
jgi:hypothetical protein